MAHPLLWPRKHFYYPIGNTAPICLTQDLGPEQSVDILLLGCGDPRHILFTIYSSGLASAKCMLSFTVKDFPDAGMIKYLGLWTSLVAIMNRLFWVSEDSC